MNSSKNLSFSGNLAQVAGHMDAPDANVDRASSNKLLPILTGWTAVRKLRFPRIPSHGTASQRSIAYVNAGAQYMRQVSGLLKDKVNSLRQTASSEAAQGVPTKICFIVYLHLQNCEERWNVVRLVIYSRPL